MVKYSMIIRETLPEADFFDYAQLYIADVPEGYQVWTNFIGKQTSGSDTQWHWDNISKQKINSTKVPSSIQRKMTTHI